ncbi:HAD-superfamily hydrolase [Ceraceosorus guamensis]|uniref:HAD-superfamily hydrolase n=1 Tax=Ceraceosorus guamensis TaxID=1522189 RepID=A0A316VPG2_9BASI|nr:HAD-superfamily hydrolase [Ceraceosorus guamensis]PWN39529.1 HAD-superfamily hydrolase [Ceraceosorus guamensis]
MLLDASRAKLVGSRGEQAFAFDIDGVLVRGGNPIEGLLPIFQRLNHAFSFRVPHVFLTNGGGYAEAVRAKRLGELTRSEVSEEQIIQAHTVLQELVPSYADRPVLVLGGASESKVRTVHDVMRGYGFKNFTLASEVHSWRSDVWPFHDAPEGNLSEGRTWLKRHAEQRHHHEAVSERRFGAVIVFHDSRDWGGDIQLMCDVLRSPTGQIGTLGDDTHPQAPVFFTHEDLIWTNSFPTPRFGQGAFQLAARAVYKAASGRELQATTFGKPHRATYAFAEKKLKGFAQAQGLGAEDVADVWMIGDNPASDIAGANAFGWKSALVETGVYVPGTRAAFEPTMHARSAEQAVERILAQYNLD